MLSLQRSAKVFAQQRLRGKCRDVFKNEALSAIGANASWLISFPNRGFATSRVSDDAHDPNTYRHAVTNFHPEAVAQYVFPDKTVKKFKRKASSENLRRPVELEFGYFWMLRDLRSTNDKPIVGREDLIPEKEAESFPTLKVLSLEDNEKTLTIPDDLISQNRTQDPAAQCTLVCISFRDFGYKMLPDWINAVKNAYQQNNRVEVLQINMTEGGWLFRAMAPLLKWMIARNTTEKEREYTYLFYGDGEDIQRVQTAFGLWNVLPGYVILLDGLGRPRWISSGSPTPEELELLTKKLIPKLLPKNAIGIWGEKKNPRKTSGAHKR